MQGPKDHLGLKITTTREEAFPDTQTTHTHRLFQLDFAKLVSQIEFQQRWNVGFLAFDIFHQF